MMSMLKSSVVVGALTLAWCSGSQVDPKQVRFEFEWQRQSPTRTETIAVSFVSIREESHLYRVKCIKEGTSARIIFVLTRHWNGQSPRDIVAGETPALDCLPETQKSALHGIGQYAFAELFEPVVTPPTR